ncbi:MAG: type II secretion system F family protein [Proteobacteria bacterium]|nr:type II secretion system F family protein [Pseudomonadota bacterium]
MNYYRFKAIDKSGRYIKGRLSAENQFDLINILKSSGQELISFKQEKQQRIGGYFFDKIKPKDLIVALIQLEQLDRAGVSILDAIQDLKNTAESAKIRTLMNEVHDSIKNGSLFSESLAKHPEIFSQVYVGLIAAGEKTGNLSDSFASIIDDLKWNSEMKRKASKATRGPLFGIALMFVVLGVMTSVVIPKVTSFLLSQNLDLPAITTALIAFSNFFKNYWYIPVFAWPVTWLTLKILRRSPEIEIKIDHYKLKSPIFGPILNKIDSAKFCQFFSMTFKSGMGVLECLDAASEVVKNKAMKRAITEVKKQVSDGQSLAKAMSSVQYFPNLVSRMLKIGEESGNMENALANIKFFYDREINDSIDKLVGMIQPTLTITMGGMIAWITIAVFGPIYATFSKIQ